MTAAAHAAIRSRRALRLPSVSPAAAYAIKSGVVVTVAIWLGKAPGLVENSSTWILISVLTVLQPTTGNAMLKGLTRIVGTIAGAFTAILLFGLFAQDPPLLMAGFFLVQAVGAYGNPGPRFQYAWFVWAFTSASVLGGAIAGEGLVEVVAFQRASMVAIGIVLVLVADSLLWPTRAEPKLRRSLAARARQLGAALRAALAAPSAPAEQGPAASVTGPQALVSQLALLDAARSELGVGRATADALARVALLLEAIGSPKAFPSVTIDQSAKTVAAGRLGVWPAGKTPFSRSDVFLLVGGNPLVSVSVNGFDTRNPTKRLRAARAGANLYSPAPARAEKLMSPPIPPVEAANPDASALWSSSLWPGA